MKRVLVVDDDRRMRRTFQIMIERMGLESAAAADAREAREQLAGARFDLVLSDLEMPETTGMELLEEIRAGHPALPVILITAYGTIQTAIEAMRKGASDYVLKPFDNEDLERAIRRCLELERFRSENVFLKEQVEKSWAAKEMFLALPSMESVAEVIPRLGEAIDRFERRLILHALDATNDNKAETARRLGISERNLWYKLKKHGL